MSPPDTNAISERSGDSAGSAKLGNDVPEGVAGLDEAIERGGID
jgi:hypothetical protein